MVLLQSRRRILVPLVVLSGLFPAWTIAAQEAPRNIVFILIDDQRYDAFGFMGHPFLETPKLDSLAANGLVFENAFVTTSLCSPSRATILTGLYAHKHGVLNNSTRLPAHLPTFPKSMQEAGYETAFIGKWHMGGSTDEPRPGFDYWASYRGQGRYYNPRWNVNGETVDHDGYMTDITTDYALDFLKKDHDKPFLLYVSHKAVHAMFEPAERHRGTYADETYPHPASMANTDENYATKPEWVRDQRNSWHGVDGMYNETVDFDQFTRNYAETLLAVDESVGAFVKGLEEKGLLESTLLVYTSDNGFLFGEQGLIDKRAMYEPSIRVPLIVHCPDLIPEPGRRTEMIINCDFAPTFLEVAGLSAPETMQGMSFYPLIAGRDTQWRDAFMYEYFWERTFPQTPTVLGVRTDRYKFMKFQGVWDVYELYDLQNDPHERHNLLGDDKVTTEAGFDRIVRMKADGDEKEIFSRLNRRLAELQEELDCRSEPTWRPIPEGIAD